MIRYKGCVVYSNAFGKWTVQVGYEVVGQYKTLGSAKSAITQKWSKES